MINAQICRENGGSNRFPYVRYVKDLYTCGWNRPTKHRGALEWYKTVLILKPSFKRFKMV